MMSKAETERMTKLESDLTESRMKLQALKAATDAEIESLKKNVESYKSSASFAQSQVTKSENELESAHALLDGLPKAPARETEGKESYQRKEIALTTRLASWIAKVAFSEAFAKMGIE